MTGAHIWRLWTGADRQAITLRLRRTDADGWILTGCTEDGAGYDAVSDAVDDAVSDAVAGFSRLRQKLRI